MNEIQELYQDDLIYIFNKNQINLDKDYLVIIKDSREIVEVDNCLVMHYQDNFEELLNFKIPTKNRKTKQLISYQQCKTLLNKIEYGVLSFQEGSIPYGVGLNHIILDDHIYFHCARSGFKLNSRNKRAHYLVVDDLGINKEVGTHNHDSVSIIGEVVEVLDFDTKKAALLQLVASLAPKHPYNDKMVDSTTILELKIDYMIGKTHIR